MGEVILEPFSSNNITKSSLFILDIILLDSSSLTLSIIDTLELGIIFQLTLKGFFSLLLNSSIP